MKRQKRKDRHLLLLFPLHTHTHTHTHARTQAHTDTHTHTHPQGIKIKTHQKSSMVFAHNTKTHGSESVSDTNTKQTLVPAWCCVLCSLHQGKKVGKHNLCTCWNLTHKPQKYHSSSLNEKSLKRREIQTINYNTKSWLYWSVGVLF